jgi:nucleoid-associated protein YejK
VKHTEQELRKLPKGTLAEMHKANGGLMLLSEYRRWSKDELVSAVLEDESR